MYSDGGNQGNVQGRTRVIIKATIPSALLNLVKLAWRWSTIVQVGTRWFFLFTQIIILTIIISTHVQVVRDSNSYEYIMLYPTNNTKYISVSIIWLILCTENHSSVLVLDRWRNKNDFGIVQISVEHTRTRTSFFIFFGDHLGGEWIFSKDACRFFSPPNRLSSSIACMIPTRLKVSAVQKFKVLNLRTMKAIRDRN